MMEIRSLFPCLVLFFLFSNPNLLIVRGQLLPIVDDDQILTYIVHVEKPEGSELLGDDLERWHESFLPNATLDSGEPRLVYSYRHAISGFAARLTRGEVMAMEAMDGFVQAKPDEVYPLLTTYTPKFLNLSDGNGTWSKSSHGDGMIIGILDSGILPTHPSFHDRGMRRPPSKWKGGCFTGFACNNKIIGAVAFNGRHKNSSPIDNSGHGTHVASIAAGNFVHGANVLGMANGTACGTAPRAHLAIYKVCNPGCGNSNVLAGIDQAIDDGVDVINLSLGPVSELSKFYDNSVVQGSLAAIRKGIIAVAAAGNSGPDAETLSHSAPWVLTVGATSTDRRITAIVKLGNGEEFEGESAYQPDEKTFNSTSMPIVFPGIYGNINASYCLDGSLDTIDVVGKIVLCWIGVIENVEKGRVVDMAGGAAMIVMNGPQQGYTTLSEAHVIPTCHVNFMDGSKIRSYVYNSSTNSTTNSTSTPTAAISFNGTQFGCRPSPGLGYFSSRGPSKFNGGILKPDVLAPGVNILAAWPFEVGPYPTGFATSTFNFESGTSMASPHVAGIAALVKRLHPNWTPAAIQSAIITSACELDLDGNIIVDENSNLTADVFYTGAGQVNATGALHPGLVYDIDTEDYMKYMCGLGYTDREVRTAWGQHVRCSKVGNVTASNLNYPSITWHAKPGSRNIVLQRTVRNVGPARSDYQARITEPAGVRVDLSRYQLRLTRGQQNVTFQVTLTITASNITVGSRLRGKLEWVSDKHVVTSPIAVFYS